MRGSISRILALSKKEWLHILHDPRSLAIIILMPILQLTMFGYALDMEIKSIRMSVFDFSNSEESWDLLKGFQGSDLFKIHHEKGSPDEAVDLFKARSADVVMVIEKDFGKKVGRNQRATIQLIIDASDPNAAKLMRDYCRRVIQDFNGKRGIEQPVEFSLQPRFNPSMESSYFYVPGLIAMILIMISALLTSITVTREIETGTMEQLLISPVRPIEIILGKLTPYIVLAIVIGTMILGIGIILFNVAFIGSPLLLLALSLLYILVALSLGLLISTIAPSQQTAMMGSILSTLMPTILLSGFIFPIASMPLLLQYVSRIIPARYFLIIIRGIMLKGNTIEYLLEPVLVLAGFSVLLLAAAWRNFRKIAENKSRN